MLQLALDYMLSNNPEVNIFKEDLKKLFQFAISETHFYFNGEIYEEVDGVAMGFPLTYVLANLFMGHQEQHGLIQKEALSVFFYKRYVDDIFCILKTSEQADKFLDFLNTRHKNIKFPIEKQLDQKVPFLDVLIPKTSNNRITRNYKKSTDTGLLTNYLSFIPTRI